MAVILTIVRGWKLPTCPLMDEWIRPMWLVCPYTGIFLRFKKEGNFDVCYNMVEP